MEISWNIENCCVGYTLYREIKKYIYKKKRRKKDRDTKRNGAKVCQKSVLETRIFLFEEKSNFDDARALEEIECGVRSC